VLSDVTMDLRSVFPAHVSMAFGNAYLNEENLSVQKELVFALGDTIHAHSKETGNHVRRVADYSRLLGELAGLDQDDVQLVWMVAPLHDLGKIGIPKTILGKTGALTSDEWDVVKTHTTLGHSILKAPNCRVLNRAAVVAWQHHEHWDGSGYPRGLKGEEIDIFGRLVALADVFDALGGRRAYKEPWPRQKILSYLQGQRGRQFEPQLVDILTTHIEAFTEIRRTWPDAA